MSPTQTCTDEVSNISCSQTCIDKFKSCREQIDLLVREVEDLRYDGYTLRKSQKPLKEKLEAQIKDYKRVRDELIELKNHQLPMAQYNINRLTAELAASNARFKDAEFSFKKFDVSSAKVETMIETQLKFKDQKTEGLGYNNVPPPYNYTPPLEPVVLRRPPPVSQSSVPVLVKIETPKQVDHVKVNESNASTSCADEVLVEDWDEEDENNSSIVDNSSNTNTLSPAASNNCVTQEPKTVDSGSSQTDGHAVLNSNANISTVEKYKPKKFVRPSDKCTCTCGASSKQKQSSTTAGQKLRQNRPLDRNIMKRQTCFCCGFAGHIARNCPSPPTVPVHAHHLKNISKGDSFKRKSSRSCSNDSDWSANKTRTQILTTRVQTGPRPSPNHMVLKRQTCFNCGTPGHIARNCPHRPYVPYYAQNWQNVPRRKSSKRGNFSRSRSSDGDWNADKAKNQASRDMTNMRQDSRDAFTKPKWVRSKSSQGSSSSSHLKFKPKAKGRPNSKSSVETPMRSNKRHKPDYRWVPKVPASNKRHNPVITSCSLSNKQDMVWEQVPCVDGNGKPSYKMDWVAKTN
jgi:hypothetical protein